MKKVHTRILATALSAALCLGMVPVSAREAAPDFTPESLSGLLAWYDASSVTKDGEGNISKLVNKAAAGTGYDAVQDAADAQPLYVPDGAVKPGEAAIRLRDGDYLRIGGENGFDLDDMTIVAVLNVDALTATVGNQICSRKQPGSGSHNWYFNVTSEHKADSINFGWKEADKDNWCSVGTGGAEIAPGETYTLIARKSGADAAVNVNGVKAAFTGPAAPQKNTSPVLLGTPNGYADNEVTLNADYAAFLLFDRGLTDEETAQLEAYLTETYLPAADPGPGGAFTPADLSGLKAWYDAADLTALGEGGKVAAWPNKAGDGFDAVQTAEASQPVYELASKLGGSPAVRLDKGTYLEVQNSFNLDDMSIFVVMNADNLDGNSDANQIFSKLGGRDPWDHNWYFNISDRGFNFGWKDQSGYNDFKGPARAMSPDVSYILGGVKAGNEGRLYMNGNRIGAMTGGGNALHNDQPIFIGGTGAGQSVKGVIGEIIVYDRGLTPAETEQVSVYLSEKWGIALNESTDPVDGAISINGTQLRAFSTSCKTYKHVLEDSVPPTVTADFPGATVNVRQAEAVPGSAVVTVTKGSLTTSYTIEFTAFAKELVNLQSPTVEQVAVTGGFWKDRLELFYTETIGHVFDNFERTGTLRNFEKLGTPGARPEGSTDPWNDGLLYETIRGASDFMRANPGTLEFAALKTRIDGYIDTIYQASLEHSGNGYLSTWAMMERPGSYFDATGNARWYHDAYNFGCMAEAAVHYYQATGSTKLLYVATRFAEFLVDDYGYGLKEDGAKKINMIPSHEGPEEMLLKLYQLYRDDSGAKAAVQQTAAANGEDFTINEEEYADLVKFWIENHGNYDGRVNGANYGEYAQDHARYFDQTVAKGHAVRANLFYTGIAAAGREFRDYTYLTTAENLWHNIVDKQMYITGGVGAQGADEAYGPDYDLPNNGYCETCAQVAMGFFSEHMALAFADAEYADIVERYIYDGVLGAVGDTGKTYYYQQPLSDKNRARWEWIDHTPCCPPMFLKFYGEMPAYLYAYQGSEVYVNQFVTSELTLDGMTVTQESGMPWGGTSTFATSGVTKLHIRLPEWAVKSQGEISVSVEGQSVAYTTVNGYAVVDVAGGKSASITFPMEPRREYSDPNVTYNEGKVALAYGPMVYCVESTDVPAYVPNFNVGDGNLGIPRDAALTTRFEPELLGGVQTISFTGEYYNTDGEKQTVQVKAIPFFARSNRGDSSTFVWVDEEVKQFDGKMKRWLANADQSRGLGNSAAAAFDGDTATFWAAGGPEVPQALMVDLGEAAAVGKVVTTFTSAQAWKYQVYTSMDAVTWELFADNSTNAVNQQTYTDTGSKQARYVAVKFVESAGVGYISVQEVAVMAAGSETNLALNKLCAASTVSTLTDSVFAMIDGNKETRYCPPNNDKPRVLTMDLGAQADITGVKILFEKPTDWSYKLELSADGKTWTEYHSETYRMEHDGDERLIEKEAAGRYVRLTITGTTGGVWASVWEFDVLTKEPLPDLFDALMGGEAPEPETPAPALYYDFADGTKDQSGNGKDAVIHGDVSVLGGMALLSGGYIQLPDRLTDTEEITVSAWVWHREAQNNARVFDLGGVDQHRYYNLFINGSNEPLHELRTLEDTSTMQTLRGDGVKVEPGTWVHVATTFKNGEAKLYVDGVLVAAEHNITLSSPKDLGDTTRNYLGKSRFSKPETETNFNDPNFLGLVKEFKVYNAVLTAEEVVADARNTSGQEKAADALKLKAVLDALDLGDLSEVFGDLALPTEQEGVRLSWVSDHPELIANDGAYTAPAEDGETAVTLTVTAEHAGMSLQRNFTATVVRRTDAQIAQAEADALGLVTLVDTGKLTLPTAGKRGAAITWATSDAGVIAADGTVSQPAPGEGSRFVDLTATIHYGSASVEKQFPRREVMERYSAFLLTYFGGNELMGNVEQEYATVHFAYSYDGLHWVPLNDNNHVVAATIKGKDNPAYGQDRPDEALARDPVVLRQQDGKLRLLSSHSWNNHDIYVWDAGDLTSFSGERILSVNTDKGNAWAPEVVYDPVQEQYMVVFTDPWTANAGVCGYGTYTTDFTQADVDANQALGLTNLPLLDLSQSSRRYIDCSMYAYDGAYYMPFRYWTGANPYNGVALAKSDTLAPGSFRVVDTVSDESIGDGNNEGPFIIKALDRDRWYLYYDYPDCGSGEEWGMFGVSYTDDLDSGVWHRVPFDGYTMPYGVRHGNAIPITQGELDKLVETYGAPENLDVAQLSQPVVYAAPGTSFADLNLPGEVPVTLQDGAVTELPVTWQAGNYRTEAGRYKVYGTFDLSAGGVSNSKDYRPFVLVCVDAAAERGLVADLDFTAVDGNTVLDGSGYGNHMSFVSEPQIVDSDRGGKALVLDGTNWAEMPKELLMNMDAATVAFWVKMDEAQNWSRVFDFGKGQSNYINFIPKTGEDGNIRVEVRVYNEMRTIKPGIPFPVGQWTHVAVTLDPATMQGVLYLNGEEVGRSDAFYYGPQHLGMNRYNQIGKSQFNDPVFKGLLGQFQMYDYALTAAQVHDLAAGNPPVTETCTLTVTAGAGGSVSPDGSFRVTKGSSQTFQVTPDEGYKVAGFLAGEAEVAPSADGSYEVANIQTDLEITVTFAAETMPFIPPVTKPDTTQPAGGNATAVGGGAVTARTNADGSVTYTFTPEEGKDVLYVRVNGLLVPAEKSYTAGKGETPSLVVVFGDPDARASGQFPDMAGLSEETLNAIDYVAVSGLFNGMGDGAFSPDAGMSRAMFATVLARLYGAETGGLGESGFNDVSLDAWYGPAVAWCAGMELVSGIGGGRFAPERGLTRQELVTLVWRFAARVDADMTASGDLTAFRDADAVDAWAADAMAWAVGLGLVKGRGADQIAPNAPITRAECAILLQRMAELVRPVK